ncbi:MAG TPA: HAMP domain-containing sensor histidine kinase [Ignavibacteriales bacterium]|nr:HAMP domain-containing sensor histidine kinase [Ignavibacteriales bacterium]HOL80278.1 HAMP domain-containing sensor histidine kinase [Ignavibacteriales bacterium]HOM64557.1 HAMP domain-containing sensor histidine kinase [Ignavibacteriales bacterium]HPD66654.1 HAMP domain-containing sensor histidine kinase [Ignavibacteriales bacterium]HPP32467.1 HAMP domain-containing sensor histidine kinase [Ignavibacteriales bacterium]
MQNEQKKLEELGKLSAILAHEIRNPLSVLKLNLDNLGLSENLCDEDKQIIELCKKATNRIEFLIDNTLNLSRKSNEHLELININDIINNALQILDLKLRDNNIKVIKNLDANLPSLQLNPNKILQVFINLITNSIEALSIVNKQKQIEIQTVFEKDIIKFSIKDNGKGISEQHQKKIFDDFFTSKKNGTGIGLSVCKIILEEYDAKFYFESKLNKFTVFYIEFPTK